VQDEMEFFAENLDRPEVDPQQQAMAAAGRAAYPGAGGEKKKRGRPRNFR
jgi:hypothetical protein